MEGVTSLVMFPQLVENNDPINNIQYQLATGMGARCLEQELKKNEITTVGDLAGLDNKAVTNLRGVKPPKIQTVKMVLGVYFNKIKREETVVRKGTPVQEETSQEEEDRIKEDIFSRPSPSPTDMAAVIDSSQDDSEDQKESKEDVKTVPDTESVDVQVEEEVKTVPAVDVPTVDEVKTVTAVDVPTVEEAKTVPETEPITEHPQEEDVPEKVESPGMQEESITKVSVEDSEDQKDGMEVDDGGDEVASVENTPDSTSSVENIPETPTPAEEVQEKTAEKSEGESPGNEDIGIESGSQPILNVSDVKSVLDSDIDPNTLSDTDIKTLISTLFDHSKKVEAMKEKAVQVLANRLR